jgi:hypothetical protein
MRVSRLAGLVVAAGVFGIVSSARADPQFPPHKAGLWEGTMKMSNMMMNGQPAPSMGPAGGMVTFSCVDPASDLKLEKRMAAGEPGCSVPVWGGSGAHYTFTNTCSNGGGTTSMAGAMTYVNDEHIIIDMQMSGTGMTGTMHGDSQWSGACPDGIVPGDFGMVMGGNLQKEGNVLNMP